MNEEFHNLPPDADAAFAKCFPRAAELPWSVGVLTGNIELSPEQTVFLNHCARSGNRLNSEPVYGHLAVRCLGTEGYDNQAAAVQLSPSTPECRWTVDSVNCLLWATWFAVQNDVRLPTAQSLWRDAHGDEPTLKSVAELWPWRKCSDIDIEKAGFRLDDPAEIDALKIVRRYP